MKLIQAFLFRDIAIEKKYRFDYLLRLANAGFQLLIFYFIGRMIVTYDYFSFVLVGIVFSRFFQFWLGVFAENIRMEQYWGTAEILFLSPSNPLATVISSTAGKFILLLAELAVIILGGKYILGANLPLHHMMLFAPYLIFCCMVFAGLGLISAAFIVFYKRGDPVNMFVSVILDLLSGVYFPLTVFSAQVQAFAKYLPTTRMLNDWRQILSAGKFPGFEAVIIQALWGMFFLVAGIVCFNTAYRKARVKGELGSY
ncbi:MAG: ABC transporter permease [Elusimicrobiota bacterium]